MAYLDYLMQLILILMFLSKNGDSNYRSLPLIKVLDGKTESLKLTEETVLTK